MPDRTKSSF